MKEEPCSVCGSTDLNLIDGYYYCVECGTQDANVRETVVEQTYLADGTLALVSGKKFATIVKDGIEMSGEWHKWHAYNFVLVGLTEELIKLGAKPSLKPKVLWIWTRYIKQFQVKEDLEDKSKIGDVSLSISRISRIRTESENSLSEEESEEKEKKPQSGKFTKNIKIVTKGLILAILYLALNFDKSHIQLSHVFRFIKEGRLSFLNCTKYVPIEIETKSIPHWKSFLLCQSDYNSHTIRAYAMSCIKSLDLGLPIVPDLNKIIDSYIKELCLPNDFKDLVLSLMLCHPCDYLDLDRIRMQFMVRLPDYESVAMSYVLVALKMCFGLDGDYEVRMSDVVDKINYKENHIKSHKLGMCSEPSDRLFSFLEWTRFLQFRKTILCQYYLPMARIHNKEVDDYILMEQLEERNMRPIKLRDEVTMDILNKIPYQKDINLIPKSEFQPCLSPMSTYTDVIINHVINDEVRLLLSEDFTQYNLKYATKNLALLDSENDIENLIVGISETNKKVERDVKGNFEPKQGDMSMVFIRNCENKNWLVTNPPTAKHVTKVGENEGSDKDSDHGYDSNVESTPDDKEVNIEEDEEAKLEVFEEENENVNIFDDNFDNLMQDDKSFIETINNVTMPTVPTDFNDDVPLEGGNSFSEFDLNNLDRQKMIDELISLACEKYKIPKPKEKTPRQPRKRSCKHIDTEAGVSAPKKKRRIEKSETQININEMISAYYKHVENDILTELSQQVKNAIEAQNSIFENVLNNTLPDNQANDAENTEIPERIDTNLEQSDHYQSLINNSVQENVVSDTVCGTDNLTELNSEQNDDSDPFIQREDPNFDSKTHNIKQLYLKLDENVVFDDLVNIEDDPELNKIINDKIKKVSDGDVNITEEYVKDATKTEISNSDSEDDECINMKQRTQQEREKIEKCFEPLINDSLKIKEYKYWLRHYNTCSIGKNLDMHEKFDMELTDKFPASFNFVIGECAGVLGCSTYNLYKSMQKLEIEIIKKNSKLRTTDV
ncbi:uncharacterized protein TAF1B [Battus philenor]|uniref:uncharacterized protein TAF1B n=1 Tax=Battus philenor TaxID=42288 RepID=UPI0035CF1452